MPKVKNSKCDILSNFQIICPSRPNSIEKLFSKNSVEFIFHVEENFANCCCYFFWQTSFFLDVTIINRCHCRHLPTLSSLKNNFFSLICQISSSFFALEAKSRGFLVWKKKAKKNFFSYRLVVFFRDFPTHGWNVGIDQIQLQVAFFSSAEKI